MKFLRHHRLGSLTLVLAILLIALQGCGKDEAVKPGEETMDAAAGEMEELTGEAKDEVREGAEKSFGELDEAMEEVTDPTAGELPEEPGLDDSEETASGEQPVYTIQFSSGTRYDDSDPQIEEAATYLKENAEAEAEIQGHTDSEGPVGLNQRLSQRRADTIRRALINLEVEGSRLEAVGYGSNNPVSGLEETDPENRRVVIRIK